MPKQKLQNPILLIILFITLSLFTVSHFSQAAWQAPTGGAPYAGNDVFSFLLNKSGNDSSYFLDKSLGINNKFNVNSNVLYVDNSLNRVGVMTNTPQVALDVNGVLKIGKVAIPFVSCPSSYATTLSCSNGSTPVCSDSSTPKCAGTLGMTPRCTNLTTPTCSVNPLPCTSNLTGSLIFNTNQDRLNICVNNAWHRVGYDGDMDHWLDYADCNDSNATIYPGAAEVCGDTIDNNCNGQINEGCSCVAVDWSPFSATCPDMSACTNYINYYGSKIPNDYCVGSGGQPSLHCPCYCSAASYYFNASCSTCVTTTYQINPILKPSIISCTEIGLKPSPITCAGWCTGSCSGNTCCTDTATKECYGGNIYYLNSCGAVGSLVQNCSGKGCTGTTCCTGTAQYTCSGNYRVYTDACGGTSSNLCSYKCSGGVCITEPPVETCNDHMTNCDFTWQICVSCTIISNPFCTVTNGGCNCSCVSGGPIVTVH